MLTKSLTYSNNILKKGTDVNILGQISLGEMI